MIESRLKLRKRRIGYDCTRTYNSFETERNQRGFHSVNLNACFHCVCRPVIRALDTLRVKQDSRIASDATRKSKRRVE